MIWRIACAYVSCQADDVPLLYFILGWHRSPQDASRTSDVMYVLAYYGIVCVPKGIIYISVVISTYRIMSLIASLINRPSAKLTMVPMFASPRMPSSGCSEDLAACCGNCPASRGSAQRKVWLSCIIYINIQVQRNVKVHVCRSRIHRSFAGDR